MTTPTPGPNERTKDRLLEAGEHLFARNGINGVTLREINDRAGQRNSSALHYHFGTRDNLVLAILKTHQRDVDAAMDAALNDSLIGQGATVRQVLEAVVPGVAHKLLDPRGCDFLRIIPQILPELSRTVRAGRIQPTTRTSDRVLALLDHALGELPAPIRSERRVAYVLVLTTTLAERAQAISENEPVALDHEEFVANLVSVLAGALTAPAPTLETTTETHA